MAAKVTELTPEQKLILPRFRAEWLAWGTCTDRADRQKAEAAIMAMRARIGVTEKPVFIWCDSPATSLMALHFLKSDDFKKWHGGLGASLRASLGASLGASLRASLGASLRASLGDSLRASLRDSLWASLGDSLRDSLGASLGASLRASLRASLGDSLGNEWWGQHDSYWIAFYLLCRDVVGVKYKADKSADLDLWRDVAQSCCWWWCHQHYVVISDRPTAVRLDDRNVLHCENGPALAFADGWAVHAWHGIRVPGEWIENKASLTPAAALGQTNVEQRRAACEIIGWAEVLKQLKARSINTDADPAIGELLEVSLPDSGKERFLRVLCGTGRTFCIPVPPTVRTALEANAWTWGLDSIQFIKPEIRT